MSKNLHTQHYFIIVLGNRCLGGNPDHERILQLAEFFGEGAEIHQVDGAMPSDLSEVAARFYQAQEEQIRDEVEGLLGMSEEDREELLDAIENPDVRAMFERPTSLDGEWPEDCDTTHVTSRSGLFKATKFGCV